MVINFKIRQICHKFKIYNGVILSFALILSTLAFEICL